jgi:hypothetical protein
MPDVAHLSGLAIEQSRGLIDLFSLQPELLLLVLPVVIGLLSRSAVGIAGAVATSALALLAAVSGTTDNQRILALVFAFSALIFAFGGFAQRRMFQRVRELELRQAEAEHRFAGQHERELLQTLRRHAQDTPSPTSELIEQKMGLRAPRDVTSGS